MFIWMVSTPSIIKIKYISLNVREERIIEKWEWEMKATNVNISSLFKLWFLINHFTFAFCSRALNSRLEKIHYLKGWLNEAWAVVAQEPSILDRLAKPSSSFLKRLCMGMCSPNRSAAFGSLVNESTYCRMCSFLEALATPFYSRKLLFVCLSWSTTKWAWKTFVIILLLKALLTILEIFSKTPKKLKVKAVLRGDPDGL